MRSLTLEDQILKADRRGRVRVPRERREALLAEFKHSGASAAEFARLVGVKYATFAGWVAQERRLGAAAGRPAPAVPAVMAAGAPAAASGGSVRLFEALLEASPSLSCPIVLELPGGVRLLVAEAGQVPLAVELLAALSRHGSQGGRPC
jgi:transposase-like protein